MRKFYLHAIAAVFSLTIMLNVLPGCSPKKDSTYQNAKKEEDENDEYDGPDKAAEFERKRNLDPNTGIVPTGKMWQAVEETENLKNTNFYNNSSTNVLTPLSWVERGSNSDVVGPSNGNTRPGGGVTSGRMRTVWVDLADPTGKTVWVGGISGGLWKTTDITAALPTWTLINDYLSNLAVSGICQDPTNTNTMYFCTGESYFTGGGVGGVGVFKSTDHGITWTLLPSTSTLTRCTKILCDASGNVYVSTLGISIAVGLQRSTNGGSSWVSINPFTTTSRIPDFEISSTGTMHVVGGLSSAAGIGGYAFSTNPAAASPVWQSATTLYTLPIGSGARVELTCVGNTVYAALSNADKIDAIGKSIDGGVNWITNPLTATNVTDLNGGGQGTYSNGLTVDPSDPNTVIVGSLRLLKSIDGGVTFTKISEWVGNSGQYVHADIHNMAWYDNGNKLLVGSDGGLFYSANKGTNFSDKNTGIRIKQFYGVSIHPTSTNYFLAGAQDNGTHQFNGPGLTSSVEVLGGDGGITAIDQDEPLFQTGTYVYANFRRSTNGGATWISNGSSSTAGQFINPYDYDNVANKVYAGYNAGQYYRWEDPQSGFTFTPITVAEFGTASVASATVSPYTENRVYFGMTNGKVFKIDNANSATPIVTDITPSGIAAGYVNSVNIGINDQDISVTLASAFVSSTTSIWTTTNGGTSWSGVDGNLPEMPVYWAVYHPDSDTKMYIATEAGVWSTDLLNGSSTVWTPESSFPTVKTSMLKYRASDRTIAAATYGRGLWTATIPNGTCTSAAITTQPLASTVCVGTNATFTVTATGFAPLTYQWQVSTTGPTGTFTNVGTNSSTLTLTGVTTAMNNNVYHVIITNTCPSTVTSANVVLTVQSTSAPTVTSPVTYCQNASATALTAVGTSLLWYGTNATGGTGSTTAPTPSTATIGSSTYYVSQTGTCGEGPRAAIIVTVTAPPSAPVVTSSINYCQGAAAIALTASGTNLLWYTASTGGTGSTTSPVPSTAVAGSIVYYVSQTTGGCESPRSSITVIVTAAPSAPGVANITYCQGSTATALTASGTGLLWYGTNATGGTGSTTAPIPSTATLGNTIYYVSQSNGNCESPRAAITVSVVASTPAPTVTSPVAYCQGSTAIALTATGTNLLWYGTNATGGTGSSNAPVPSTTTAGSITYYVSQTTNCGEGPRAAIVVTVTATPSAPSAASPVNYCQGSTATALVATGTNLLWYTTATGGTGATAAPVPNTAITGSTTYYVSQSTGSCESGRTSVVVNINPSPAAPTVNAVSYCQGNTATALTAGGTGLLWYTTATGGTGATTAPTPGTATAGSTTYYVTQTSGTCESPRAALVVTVNALPAAPVVTSPVNYCQNSTATALIATGTNLKWYTVVTGGTGTTTAPTPITTTLGSTNYYVSQTNGTCEGPRAQITVNITAQTPAPTVISTLTYCQGSTAPALSATGTGLLWYTSATGGTGSATSPVPATTTAGSTTFYVSQTSGCGESPRAAITVNVNAAPTAPVSTANATYCQGATATVLTASGTNLLWYTTATGGTGSSTAPVPATATAGTTNYYVSQTTTGCESNRTAVTVTVNALPTAPTGVGTIAYCQGSTAAALSATGTGLLWYTTATGGVGSATAPVPSTAVAGSITYYVSQTNSCGEGARTAIVVNTTAAPLAVTNLTATNITETSAVLNWNGTAGSFYTIEYKLASATTWTVAATGITANTVTINNLTRGGSYNFRVFANCSASAGGNVSAVATFTTTSRNSNIAVIKKGFGLKLTPNPLQSAGVLDYIVPGNGTVGISIIDANGQILKTLFNANQNGGQYSLNISTQLNSVSKGTYFIKLTQNGNGISLKFIKN